jgi:pimeloyl-ACP methyl ester carboxylesterase
LVVVGAEDVNAPLAAGEKIARLIKGSSLTIMPGLGHFPPFEAPQVFNTLLRSFLQDLPAATALETAQ